MRLTGIFSTSELAEAYDKELEGNYVFDLAKDVKAKYVYPPRRSFREDLPKVHPSDYTMPSLRTSRA